MEWYDRGYFRLYGDLRRQDPYRYLAQQYLVDTIYDYDGKTGVGRETKAGCLDYPIFNLLTLEQAKNTKIDIVLCSVHENEEYFYRLKEFYPNAKFIRHTGNSLDTVINDEMYPNLMSSALAPFNAFKKHKVMRMEEFDLNLFKYRQINNFNNIYTFQGDIEGNEKAWRTWLELRHKLGEYNFKSYGVGNEDGKIYPKRQLIDKMLESSFIYQSKGPWEGFGHVIFNAFCLGRPPLVYKSDYEDKLAGRYLEDEKTCLFVDDDMAKTLDKVRYWSKPDNLRWMSTNIRKMFEDNISFDDEFLQVKKFLEELI